ncbi:MAG: DUF2157 domain-containing protein [Ruminococcus sp.]|nr:DUF2157 domain-containing protein [Ruminococcus sp.]
MEELILLLIFVVVVMPVAVIAGIVFFIVRLAKRNRNRKNSVISVETQKPVRKFSGSEIMFIIGTLFIILSGIAFGCAGWVNTSPAGRVLIMLAVSVVMYGAGVIFRKFLKLDRTSSAFGVIGIILFAMTNITAGYYELFGEWFSVSGEGNCMLFAVSSVIVAISAFAESRLTDSNAFRYLSCMSVTSTLIFLFGQISEDYSTFAIIMTLVQTVVTLWFVFGKIENNVVKNSAKISAVIFSVLAFVWVTDEILVPDGATYFIMLITLVQLIGYGIYLNNPTLKGLQSILSIMTAFAFVSDVMEYDNNAIMLFSAITLVIYSANRFVPCMKNRFSEVFTFGFAIYSAVACATLSDNFSVITPVIMSLLIMSYAFAESKSVQVLAGLCSPVLPVIIATNFSWNIYDIYVAYGVLVIALCAVTVGIIFLPKYAFGLYAKFPRKTDTILYTNMIVAGITALYITESPEMPFTVLTACIVHIVVSAFMKNNWTGIFSVLGMINLFSEITFREDNQAYIMFSLFCGLIALARVFFRDGLIVHKNNTTRIDIIMIVVWYAIISISSNADKTESFFQTIATSMYIANFIRKKTNQTTSSVILSVSAVITAIAFINRPFLVVESEMVSSKITLAIIMAVGIAYRYIWKNSPKVSKNLSDTIFILSFAGLIRDVMFYSQIGNTIFGLAVTAVILIVSFSAKNRKWFGISSIALVTITVWASMKYFGKLDWWAYLFIAGILFIAVASVNEYFRSHNKKFSDIFAEWK